MLPSLAQLQLHDSTPTGVAGGGSNDDKYSDKYDPDDFGSNRARHRSEIAALESAQLNSRIAEVVLRHPFVHADVARASLITQIALLGDLMRLTNTVPKSFLRQLEELHVENRGLGIKPYSVKALTQELEELNKGLKELTDSLVAAQQRQGRAKRVRGEGNMEDRGIDELIQLLGQKKSGMEHMKQDTGSKDYSISWNEQTSLLTVRPEMIPERTEEVRKAMKTYYKKWHGPLEKLIQKAKLTTLGPGDLPGSAPSAATSGTVTPTDPQSNTNAGDDSGTTPSTISKQPSVRAQEAGADSFGGGSRRQRLAAQEKALETERRKLEKELVTDKLEKQYTEEGFGREGWLWNPEVRMKTTDSYVKCDVLLRWPQKKLCVYIECKVLDENNFSHALGQVIRYELKHRTTLLNETYYWRTDGKEWCTKSLKIVALDRRPSVEQREEARALDVYLWWPDKDEGLNGLINRAYRNEFQR
tara:strand:+ start:542 stop:1960 length:1419 start_codon:yes stop_codon:yes gene_type:complete